MKKPFVRTAVLAVLAALALLAVPSVASARPWGGSGFNDLGPAYLLLGVQNGQAKVKNVQLILACTDTQDGTESSRAFDARFGNWRPLRLNRFSSSSPHAPTGASAWSGSGASCAPTGPERRACGSSRRPRAKGARRSSAAMAKR
jgi:hypothetical protein